MLFLERIILNYPLWIVLLLALVTAALLPGLFERRTDVEIESFLPESDSGLAHYGRYLEIFGSDNLLLAFFRVEDAFSDESLGTLRHLSDSLRELAEVSWSFCITDAFLVDTSTPVPLPRPLVGSLPLDEKQRAELRETVDSHSLYRGKVVSLDGTTPIVIIFLDNSSVASDEGRVAAVRNVQRVLRSEAGGRDVMLTGTSLLKTTMSDAVSRDFVVLAPIVVAVGLLFLWLAFRSFWALLFGVVAVGMTLVWTLSIFFQSGFTLNMATILLPSLVMALSFAQVIFIISRYQRTTGEPEKRVAATVRRAAPPCFLAALTTAAGFFSLTATSVVPIRDFGITAAVGIGLAFLIAILFVPSAIRLRPLAIRSLDTRQAEGWRRFLVRLSYRPVWVAVLTLLLVAASQAGLWRVRIDTSPYEFFPPGHELNRTREAYLEATGFDSNINLMIYRKDGNAMDGPALSELADLRDSIIRHRLVADTLSPLTIGGFLLGDEDSFIELLGDESDPRRSVLTALIAGDDLFRRYLSDGAQYASLTVMLRDHAAERIHEAIEHIESAAARTAPNLNVVPTGQTVLFAEMVDNLFYSQMASVALILLFVTVVFVLAFRSLVIGLISLIPNVTPILLTLALMGWLGIPLNIATIMVSSIAIGISVDATIHFMHSLRRQLARGAGYDEAIDLSFEAKARPILITSLLLTAAFLCYLFSSFLPIFYLGVLTAFTMMGALIGALVLLPALLRIFRPRFRV